MAANLLSIVQQFQLPGQFLSIAPIEKGHINDTYILVFQQGQEKTRRYIMQRINQFVFKKPEQVMGNIELITAHLRKKILAAGGDPERETLNPVSTLDGSTYYRDEEGEVWRIYLYIEGASAYEVATSQELIYRTAWAFGNFQQLLSDFPAVLLHETIPDFHNTPWRYEMFLDACERNPHGRADEARAEIEFLKQRKADTSLLIDQWKQGLIPLRVTHNDTKLNNVMIDDVTGEAICILDLDTVMPGLALYDFGDAVRTAAALISEDDPAWQRAGISLENFTSLVSGYLDAARGFLTDAEISALAFSGRLITLEQALRFLTDYLNGDVYYKVHRSGHNLDRARTQIRMVQDMEEKFDQMETIVSQHR